MASYMLHAYHSNPTYDMVCIGDSETGILTLTVYPADAKQTSSAGL